MDPFFGALDDWSALAVAGGADRFASAEGGALRALDEKDVEVGDGLPFEFEIGFFDAEEADFSANGRGLFVVEVVVGRAEPAYPEEDRSAGREVLLASTPDGLAEDIVVFGAFCAEPLTSSSAFLFTGIPF